MEKGDNELNPNYTGSSLSSSSSESSTSSTGGRSFISSLTTSVLSRISHPRLGGLSSFDVSLPDNLNFSPFTEQAHNVLPSGSVSTSSHQDFTPVESASLQGRPSQGASNFNDFEQTRNDLMNEDTSSTRVISGKRKREDDSTISSSETEVLLREQRLRPGRMYEVFDPRISQKMTDFINGTDN